MTRLLLLLLCLVIGCASPPSVTATDNTANCMRDLDAILDTVTDGPSLEAAKPKLMSRAQQFAAWAASQPPGMKKLSDQEAKQLRESMAQHGQSLMKAYRVPGTKEFFEGQVVPVLRRTTPATPR